MSSPPPPPPPAVEYTKNGATFVNEGATKVENDIIYRSEERISVSRYLEGEHSAAYSSSMKCQRGLPGPFWFCKVFGTLENHHGNVKFFISEQVRNLIGYKSNNVIPHTQFLSRLWTVMSNYPLNEAEFVPMPAFIAAFGDQHVSPEGWIKWSRMKDILSEHVYFNSSLVGVFSGRRHPSFRF